MEGQTISGKYNSNSEEDIFEKIVETKEYIENIKKQQSNYLMYIHCNNCYRKCPLSNPYCARGKNLKEKI